MLNSCVVIPVPNVIGAYLLYAAIFFCEIHYDLRKQWRHEKLKNTELRNSSKENTKKRRRKARRKGEENIAPEEKKMGICGTVEFTLTTGIMNEQTIVSSSHLFCMN